MQIFNETNNADLKFFQIERGGYLDVNLETLQVERIQLFKHGDSCKFVYPHYNPFCFHCHPNSSGGEFAYQPPSAVDVANTVLWSGIQNFDYDRLEDTLTWIDCVVAKEGFYIVLKTPQFIDYVLSMKLTWTMARSRSTTSSSSTRSR